MTITAKVTDPDGVAERRSCSTSWSDPGDYIAHRRAALHDRHVDHACRCTTTARTATRTAGDGIYTAVLPALAADRTAGWSAIASRPTDTLGAVDHAALCRRSAAELRLLRLQRRARLERRRPARRATPTAAPSLLGRRHGSVPALSPHHQAAPTSRHSHLVQPQYQGDDYQWTGTLVYDGVVYDHIALPRARRRLALLRWARTCGSSTSTAATTSRRATTTASKYDHDVGQANSRRLIQQGDYRHRGEQGMFEAVGFRLLQPGRRRRPRNTNFVHFRVIDDARRDRRRPVRRRFLGPVPGRRAAGRPLPRRARPARRQPLQDGGRHGRAQQPGPTQPIDKSTSTPS